MRMIQAISLFAATGLLMHVCVSDTSAAPVTIKAHIAFERVIQAGKDSDIAFAGVQPRPADRLTLDPSGTMQIDGKGELLEAYGRPSIVRLGDARGEIINVMPTNYSLAPGISSMHARCRFQGIEQVDCDTLPISGKLQNTLFIGMDITTADLSGSIDNNDAPSFDISIVYQ